MSKSIDPTDKELLEKHKGVRLEVDPNSPITVRELNTVYCIYQNSGST